MSTLTAVAAIAAAVLCGVNVAFQLALAAGAPWGRAAYGGQNPGVLPVRLRVSSVIGAVVSVLVALTVLRRAGLAVWAPVPDAWLPVAAWVVVGVFALSVLLNAITRSRVERAIWLPVTLVLLASSIVVALS